MPMPKYMRQLTNLTNFSSSKGDFTAGIQTSSLFLEMWVSLHYHPVVQGRLGPLYTNTIEDL
jgi:hypothetical protein